MSGTDLKVRSLSQSATSRCGRPSDPSSVPYPALSWVRVAQTRTEPAGGPELPRVPGEGSIAWPMSFKELSVAERAPEDELRETERRDFGSGWVGRPPT
jgi:hypothetical protein